MALDPCTESYRRVSAVIKREVGETTYLVDPQRDAIHQLNPVGSAVWGLLATPRNRSELARTLRLAFPDVEPGVIERDLRALLDDFLDARLIAQN